MIMNLRRQKTRFVIARNAWSALYILNKVQKGFVKPHKVLYLTRDEALLARNKMRSIHHAAYQVFEVPYSGVE